MASYWRHRLGTGHGAATAVRLLTHSSTPGTYRGYQGKWEKFARFCRTSGRQPLPATLETVLCYIGAVLEEGTVAATSLQPYLSAINRVHADFDFERPAQGPLVAAARKGMGFAQVDTEPRLQRKYLPAEAARAALDAGLRSSTAGSARDYMVIVLSYLWFHRASTTGSLQDHDVQVTETELLVHERFRKGHSHEVTTRAIAMPRTSPGVDAACRLVEHFRTLRGKCAPQAAFYGLQGESPAALSAEFIDTTFRRGLTALSIQAPPGYSFSSHSGRAGGATAAYSIGGTLERICHIGGWAFGSKAVHDYIDVTAPWSPDAAYFFSWLLRSAS